MNQYTQHRFIYQFSATILDYLSLEFVICIKNDIRTQL